MQFCDFYWMHDYKRGSICEKKNSAMDLVATPAPLRHIDPGHPRIQFLLILEHLALVAGQNWTFSQAKAVWFP
jgi:hypothetical protein